MGDINYDLGGIEGNLAAIQAIHAAKGDLSHQMVGLYSHLDSVASGRATDSGMEFSNLANQTREKEGELIMLIHQGVSSASQDMQGIDHGFMGAMGV